MAGPIYKWRDPKGNVHRGYPPGQQLGSAEEIFYGGPYIASAHFTFYGPEDATGLKAFVAAFDRERALAVIAAEVTRRRNDEKRSSKR